jgi:uncharacterized membrane protein
MEQIAVLVFEQGEADIYTRSSEDRAKDVYKELEDLAEKGEVQIESATIVVKNEEGSVKLRRTSEWTAGKGAGRGALWGLLVGLILGGPIAGLLAGVGLGAILGGRKAGGIDRDFMKQLGERLIPGNAALFVLIPGDDEATIKQLEAYNAPLYTTPLTEDVEEAVEQATEHEEVLDAIKFDELDS